MKIGIPLGGVHPGLWRDLTVRAEELGFESVWLPEHLVLPAAMSGSPHHGADHPPIPPQTPMYDAITYLAYLAGQTATIRFGTYVYNIGLRHPFVSARAATTLDISRDPQRAVALLVGRVLERLAGKARAVEEVDDGIAQILGLGAAGFGVRRQLAGQRRERRRGDDAEQVRGLGDGATELGDRGVDAAPGVGGQCAVQAVRLEHEGVAVEVERGDGVGRDGVTRGAGVVGGAGAGHGFAALVGAA